MAKKPQVKKVRVIRDPRDATRDYELPEWKAIELHRAGLLSYDVTNKAFCE